MVLDAVERARTLADALVPLHDELVRSRTSLDLIRSGRAIPKEYRALAQDLTKALNRLAAAGELAAERLAPLAEANLGIFGMMQAAQEAQREIDRIRTNVFHVCNALKAFNDTMQTGPEAAPSRPSSPTSVQQSVHPLRGRSA